jgi:uncharacterized protein (TIGR02246 family)
VIRRSYLLSVLVGALAVTGVTVSLLRSPAREADEPAGKEKEPETDALAEVRKASAEYVKAFNRGDAKAIARGWTPKGEYTGPDGGTLKGRAAIEKAYAEFFKETPKAKLESRIETLRLLGRVTAMEEGTLRLTKPDSDQPETTRYSAILVREGGKWLVASVHEYDLEPSERLSLDELNWLVGEWVAKSGAMELKASYEWDKNKKFLLCQFTLTEKGKTVTAGRQRIGKDPASGSLRAWVFESAGGFGESSWVRDGKRWVIEAAGTLPDGTETTAVNLIIPLGPDSFSFQSVNRTLGEDELADLPPIKVTRVKK